MAMHTKKLQIAVLLAIEIVSSVFVLFIAAVMVSHVERQRRGLTDVRSGYAKRVGKISTQFHQFSRGYQASNRGGIL